MDTYRERFQRQLGLMDEAGLARLRGTGVAIAGLGMGGSIFIDLVRLGIGRFHVADPDVFERSNVNRQREAKESTLGRRKDEALIEEALRINPELHIKAFPEGVQPHNVAAFLDGVDFAVDVVDVYAMPAKLALHAEARRRGIPVAACAALGYGCSVVVLGAQGPAFAELSGLRSHLTEAENLERFGRFIAPALPDYMRAQAARALRREDHLPFVVSGIEAAAALCCTEIARHLLGMGGGVVAPLGLYFDPVGLQLQVFEADWRVRASPLAAPAIATAPVGAYAEALA